MTRTAIYVDGGPFFDGIRHQGFSLDVDLMSILKSVVPGEELNGVHLFIAEYPSHPYPKKHRNQQVALDRFAEQGLAIHLCRTEIIGSVFVERGVESAMTAQMCLDASADSFDRALLVSRRQDLAPAMKAVIALGKRIDLASFRYSIEPVNPLEGLCHEFHILTTNVVQKHWRSGSRPAFDLRWTES